MYSKKVQCFSQRAAAAFSIHLRRAALKQSEHGNTVGPAAATEISLDATADAAVSSEPQAILPIQKNKNKGFYLAEKTGFGKGLS